VSDIIQDIIKAERKATDITVKNHPEVFELITTMLNLYINGFNLTGKLDDQNSDTVWFRLFSITRSFHALRCSVELMKRHITYKRCL
jgi:hypothetical protein